MTRPAGWHRDFDGALRYSSGESRADHSTPAAAEASPPKKSGRELMVFVGVGAAVRDAVDTVVVFDVPKGTDVESIELHDGPFSGGVTVGL